MDQQDTMATVNDSIIEEEETEESAMSLVEHLEELRWRIFKSLIAITLAAIVAFIFRIQIMRFLTLPLPKTADTLTKGQLVVTAVGEGFTIYLKLAFGVAFEIPLVLTFLAQLGLVSSQVLRKKRPVAYVAMWIAATFITPGADPYSPIILGIAMTFLYELTIVFIRITKH